MSARSMVRAHAREQERAQRRRSPSIGQRAALGTAVALGVGAIGPAAANAAPFNVNNTADSGAGSLRDAIEQANAAPGGDTITFGSGATGRITLTSGDIEITDALDVQGPGAETLTVSGDGSSRIFTIGNIAAPDQAVRISGLRLTEGDPGSNGGAIYNGLGAANAAELTIASSTLNNNNGGDGGAVYSDGGSLTVTDSTISRNVADGMYFGGGLYVNTTDGDQPVEVTITGSTITRNGAGRDGGGANIARPYGDVVVSDSTISANSALDDGGGIVFGYGTGNGVSIDSSTISGNESFDSAGGIWVRGPDEPVSITNSTVSGNYAGYGGGISLINNNGVPVEIANSTITGNGASGPGGGLHRYGGGPGDTTVSSTIIADNDSAESGNDIAQSEIGDITVGFSLIGSTAGQGTVVQSPSGSNRLDVNPQLGPLADNGGPTQTVLPALASPAIDSGIANGLTLDQRGLPRTVLQPTVATAQGSDGTDMGAAELAAVPPPPPPPDTEVTGTKVKAKKTQKQRGRQIKVKLTAQAAEDIRVVAKGKVKVGKRAFSLQKVSTLTAAGRRARITLNPKKDSANKTIKRALDRRKKPKALLTVKLTDDAGNRVTVKPKKVRLK